MKRWVAIILAAALTFGLVACGNRATQSESAPATTTSLPTEAESVEEGPESSESSTTEDPVGESTSDQDPIESTSSSTGDVSGERLTISVMGIDWGYGPLPNSEMEQWWEDHFDVELDVEWVSYTDYDTKLNTLMSSGNQNALPDVIQIKKVNNSFYYPVFVQAIEAGWFKDMKPALLDSSFVANNEIMSTWADRIWENASFQGKLYIVPRGTSEVAPQSGISVRRDLMREHGLEEEPTTIEALGEWLTEIAEKSDIYALDFSSKSFDDDRIRAFAVAFTGMMDWGIDQDGNFVYYAFADGYLEFLEWMKSFYDKGVLDPEFALDQKDPSNWKAGKSVAFLSAWYNWNQSADRVTGKIFDKNTPDTYEAWCLLPVKGPRGYTVSVDPYGFGEAIAVNSNVDDAKLQKIVEVFHSTGEDYISVLKNGVEGLHYDLADDGTRTVNDEQDTKRTEGYVGAWNQIFLTSNADQVTDKFMRPGTRRASDEAIERALALREATEGNVQEMNLRMANLNLESKSYNDNWATLTSDLDDTRGLFVMGQIDADAWNNYVQSIVDNPIYQQIIDEFKESAAMAD